MDQHVAGRALLETAARPRRVSVLPVEMRSEECQGQLTKTTHVRDCLATVGTDQEKFVCAGHAECA
jgi:hypothetical protein